MSLPNTYQMRYRLAEQGHRAFKAAHGYPSDATKIEHMKWVNGWIKGYRSGFNSKRRTVGKDGGR